MEHCTEDIPSFRRMKPRSLVTKVCTCAISLCAKHNGKAGTNTMWSRAMSINIRSGASEASKKADWCASTASTRTLYLCEEAVLRKTPRYKLIDCNAEAICRSYWPIRYCTDKCKPDTQTHLTTVTLWCMCAEG